MVKLSEDMIVARTRVSDMNQVKKLNCWGAELSDISVIKRLRNVEVLSLSVNSINTLADIQHCKNLQELYIRKNCIPDISEICYLRDLPRLKNLWLEENPCAEGDSELYRWTVIRNIPQLQKLDNVAVTSEEMAEAMRRGLDLDHPLDGGSSNQSAMLQTGGSHQQMPSPAPQEDERRRGGNRNSFHEQDQQQEQSYPHNQGRKESVQSPSRRVSNAVWPDTERQAANQSQSYHQQQHQQYEEYEHRQQHQQSTPANNRHHSLSFDSGSGVGYIRHRETTPDTEHMRRSVSMRQEQEQPRYDSPHSASHRPQRNSFSGHGPSGPASADYYYRGQDCGRPIQEYYSATQVAPPAPHHDHHSIVEEHYDAIHRQVDQQLEGAAQLVANRALSPQRPYPIRPKNRNSNVLSAILCLIKEIDGPSLEVVEMAVRCRMEELED